MILDESRSIVIEEPALSKLSTSPVIARIPLLDNVFCKSGPSLTLLTTRFQLMTASSRSVLNGA